MESHGLRSARDAPVEDFDGVALLHVVPPEGLVLVHHVLLVDEEVAVGGQMEVEDAVQPLQLLPQLAHVVRRVHVHRHLLGAALGQHHQPQLLGALERRRRRGRRRREGPHHEAHLGVVGDPAVGQRLVVLQLGTAVEQHEPAGGNAFEVVNPRLELPHGVGSVGVQRQLSLGHGHVHDDVDAGVGVELRGRRGGVLV